MGAFAQAFAAYAQPLVDQTDGSVEQVKKALGIAQVCYNLAQFPEGTCDGELREFAREVGMDDETLAEFRRCIIDPMIRRQKAMFPSMHQRDVADLWQGSLDPEEAPARAAPAARPHDRYAPCPCGSGKKYKFCCASKKR